MSESAASQQPESIIETPMMDKAFALIKQQPWPENIADQLEALEAKATGEDKELFGHVWESFIVLGGE